MMPENSCLYSKNVRNVNTTNQVAFQKRLKLIICYISSGGGATNIAEVSSGFHQADWSTTFGIVYCYPISIFVLVYLLTCLSELDSNNKRADENVSSFQICAIYNK